MCRAAKADGQVLIWVYGLENMEFYVNVLNPIRKALFSRLPMSLLKRIGLYPGEFAYGCFFGPGSSRSNISVCCGHFRSVISITLFSTKCCRRLRTIGRAIPSRN